MRSLERTPLKDVVLVLAPTCVAKQEPLQQRCTTSLVAACSVI